ncbi:MAG: hypothetical protein SYC29_18760 [Planctomycetota bacterium]|nr:hypothetical protein [Planctomycetota bacterium]
MKTALALACSLALAGPACAELVNVFWTDMENPDPQRRTYRLFARFNDAWDRISAYASIGGRPLYWSTSAPGGLINDDGYWEGPGHLNDLPYGNLPNIEQDTWLTIGYVGGFSDFPVFSPGFLGVPDGENVKVLVDGMTSFSDDDSAVYLAGNQNWVHCWDDEDPYDVALAQFTIESSGDEWMEMGGVLQWHDFDGESYHTEFHAVIPAPGVLPAAALALFARRRRR